MRHASLSSGKGAVVVDMPIKDDREALDVRDHAFGRGYGESLGRRTWPISVVDDVVTPLNDVADTLEDSPAGRFPRFRLSISG